MLDWSRRKSLYLMAIPATRRMNLAELKDGIQFSEAVKMTCTAVTINGCCGTDQWLLMNVAEAFWTFITLVHGSYTFIFIQSRSHIIPSAVDILS